MYVRVGDFLKTNRTKSAAIRLKSLQKAGFFNPDKLQNHTNEGKGKEKKKEPGGRKE